MNESIPDFVHLHLHTQYSLLDGAIRLDPLLRRVREFGMDSVAITDHGTMFGTVEFYEKARKADVKPIIGCECYMAPRTIRDKSQQDSKGLSHLVLLAQNQEGYTNLCKLATIAQVEGFYYKPRIDREVLKAHSNGLIALSACLHGEIPRRITEGKMDLAEEALRFYLDTFGEGNFYLEVQNNGLKLQDEVNDVLFDMSKRMSVPLVATNDCHYLDKEDVRAHEVLLCIQTGKTMNDPNRFKFGTDQLYFKSPEEMFEPFRDYPEAFSNTVDIAARCNVEFDFNTYHFPQFDPESQLSEDEIFDRKVREGYEKRMAVIREKNPDLDGKIYDDRLEYELKTIKDMGFPGYFLIVADFIQYSKSNNIPVGPGRGSAAGSMVAYAMGITDLDPIEHGLIFERFLNPSRISMPDIDVDFCINGREKVFKYVVERYGGGEYVAQIITFGKLKTKAVIRDVGRALDIPLKEVDAIAKMVPDVLNISLDDALKQEPAIQELADTRPDVGELIKISRVLEGLPRHASTHAAGVVVGDRELSDYLPLYKGKKGEIVTQFDMKRVEQIGLVKFDFLGLRNLTVIDDALQMIAQQGKTPPDLVNIDFDDKATYDLLSRGDTTGVFQLESSGMKELLSRLRPACFGDVTALVALYRPGPLDSGMVDDFVERKHGREPVEYLLPELEPILEETYGVILYQEQVMKIAAVLASYSMADADGLRKAMGKKIAAMMEEHRSLFMKGAEKNNHPPEKAKEIFDLMEKFGGYGFNKSHSAAYALIAYQTGYLKAHYPVEFMAALLTSEMNSQDGVVKFIAECRSHDIDVLPPDVNESDIRFTVVDGKIRFGLVAVKNVGEGAIESIVEVRRKDGRFSSLFDFCERVDLRKVNKRVLEALIKCGALDSTGATRSSMMTVLEDALDYGQKIQKEKNDPQMGLFDTPGKKQAALNMPVLPDIPEWEDSERLYLEKEVLGFFITGHPLDKYGDLLAKFTNGNAVTINDVADRQAVRVGGIVRSAKVIITKKGDKMAFVTLEDMHGSFEVVVFSSIYLTVADLLETDNPILVLGEVQKEENGVKIIADSVVPMDKAEEVWTATLNVNIDTDRVDSEKFHELKDVLQNHPGTCRAFLKIIVPQKTETIIELPDDLKVKAGEKLTREIGRILGYPAVETTCTVAKLTQQDNGFRRKKYGNA